ncbi:MAG TPA: CHAT domain-containing protein [Geobacteraceae bacterium]
MRMIATSLALLLFLIAAGRATHAAGTPPLSAEECRILSDIITAAGKGEKPLALFLAGTGPLTADTIAAMASAAVSRHNRALLEAALDRAEKLGDRRLAAAVYVDAGLFHFQRGENDRARRMYEQALSRYEQVKDVRGTGRAYLGLADLALRESSNEKTLELARKAEERFTAAEDLAGQGNVYRLRGHLAFYRGDSGGALEMLDRALDLFARAGDRRGTGNAQRIRGDVYFRLGDNDKARECYAASRASFSAAADPIGEGQAAWSLSTISLRTGEFQRALELDEEALALFTGAGYPIGQANVSKTEGDIYRYTGNSRKALESYERALRQYAAARSAIGQANVYKSQGNVYRESGRDAAALELFARAIPYYDAAASPVGLGEVYLAMADLFRQGGDRGNAEERYRKALGFFVQANDLTGQANVAQGMGDMLRTAGKPDQALAYYRKAHGMFVRLADARSQAFSLFRQASALEATGAIPAAARHYDEAIRLLERVRRQSGVDELKKSFVSLTYGLYEAATLFMIGHDFPEKAFRFAESLKARVFLDQLAEAAVDLRQGVDPEHAAELDALDRERSLLTVQLQDELKKVPPGEGRITELRAALERNDTARDALVRRIRLGNPRYAQVEYPEPVEAADVRQTLKPAEVLLEYFSTESGVYCFAVTRESFSVRKLPVSRTALDAKVRTLVGFIRDPQNLGDGLPVSKERVARELYDVLLGTFGPVLKDRSLILIPDGILTLLPFEMLRTGDAYAVEQHDISYFPSASVLRFLRTHRKKGAGTGSFIGFGDPVYDYGNFRAGKPEKGAADGEDTGARTPSLTRSAYLRGGGGLSRLAGSGDEVREIARLAAGKGFPAETRLRLDATVDRATSPDMAHFRFIHFSAHGIVEDRLQAIALSQVPGSADNGFLTLGDIMNSHYDRAGLVVLSACETGLGRLERGEGVSGLARAVMYAGSPAALVSLWSVDDRGTKELMVRLYRSMLQGGETPGNALRNAKMNLIREGTEFSHPFFWAPFVLYGE